MRVRQRPRAVVLGLLGTMPFGGVLWQTVHYVVGLERLGFETHYVEAHAQTPRHFMRHPEDDGAAAAAAFIDRVMRRFGLGGRWAFQALDSDGRCYGMSESRLRDIYDSAAFLLNLHGGTVPQQEHLAAERLICVATDPVQMEVELHQGAPRTTCFFNAHDVVFSFGENHGREDCRLPVCEEFPIRPTRQPVVLGFWADRDDATRDAFTTIANWCQPWREIQYRGETYQWSKHLEFLKILDLPDRTTQSLELALARCGDEHAKLLRDSGWRVRDALDVSSDLDTYRRYITTSLAEFTVAKDQNVRLRSGWFSDRSATYLAAGRPVVTQDTGFGNVLPTGEGLFAFRDADDAAEAIDSIAADYPRHRRAAAAIAREYFAHDVVLGDLLEASGVEIPRRRRHTAGRLKVMLVAHRYPPDAVGGVERYTEDLAGGLVAAGDEVHVVSRRPGPGPLRRSIEEPPSGAVVHRLAGGPLDRARFLRERQPLEELFAEALAEVDPDVVHVNHVLDLSPGILRLARAHGASLVLTLHDYYFACPRIVLRTPDGTPCDGPDGGWECTRTCFASEGPEATGRWPLRNMFFRRLLDLADRVLCPSPFVADFFRRVGADARRLQVVPNGIRVEPADTASTRFSTPGERGYLNLVFLGAVLPHKGLPVVLEALARAKLDAVHLTVCGTVGDEDHVREQYDRAARIPGLRFRMFGEYEPDDLSLLLADVDCVVVPSQWPETFCLVAREALVRGIPVVVSRMGALPDAVRSNSNGFTFEHDRPDRLAEILRRLALEDGLVPRLREGARATEVPTLADHVAAVRRTYRELVDEPGRAPSPSPHEVAELSALEVALESMGFGDSRGADDRREGAAEPETPVRSTVAVERG